MNIFPHYKTLFLTLGILNIILGALFLIWSNALIRLNEVLKKWISTDRIEEALNKVRDIDGQIMSMRKVLSFVSIALGAIFIFWFTRYQ